MDHTEALNKILSLACPANSYKVGETYRLFFLDVHCATMRVEANFLQWDAESGYAQYEIISVRMEKDFDTSEA